MKNIYSKEFEFGRNKMFNFTEQVNQNLKVCRKKRKIDDSKIKQQDFKNYQNRSKKPRQNFKCEICCTSFKTKGTLKTHIESVHVGKTKALIVWRYY